jgi:hypothetical protein
MKQLLGGFSARHLSTTSYDARTYGMIVFIAVGLIIAIYAITVNPNDATTMIGFPP